MFESLSSRLSGVFDGLKGRGVLSESNISDALREVRIALLEADVALSVVKDFIEAVKTEAVGEKVLKSVTPGQQVVKIVHDQLVQVLGAETEELKISTTPPSVMLMAGLQGSGKTTTAGKIAKLLQEKRKKKVLLASLDVYRPAAMEQLAVLAEQVNAGSLPIVAGEKPVDIAKRALKTAGIEGYDLVILDTAGRLSIDAELMAEIKAVSDVAKPHETLLVVDAMTGQDAVNTAKNFKETIPLTGIVLTRVDGDARGGAALSMRSVTGCPIKLLGMGEKLDALEVYHPDRLADRILGMGDVVSLVEKAAEVVDEEEAQKMAIKMQKGQFDLDDLAKQLGQIKKLGGMGSILGMIPGLGKMQKQLQAAGMDEGMIKRQQAILSSMTKKERKKPDLLKASRKERVAQGSGTSVPEVNKLLKQHAQMAKMMKQFSKMTKSGKMPGGMGDMMKMLGGGAGGMGGMGGQLPPGMADLDMKDLKSGDLPKLPPNFPFK